MPSTWDCFTEDDVEALEASANHDNAAAFLGGIVVLADAIAAVSSSESMTFIKSLN